MIAKLIMTGLGLFLILTSPIDGGLGAILGVGLIATAWSVKL